MEEREDKEGDEEERKEMTDSGKDQVVMVVSQML